MSDLKFLCQEKDAKIVTRLSCKSEGVSYENLFAASTFEQWERELNNSGITQILGGTVAPQRTVVEIKIMSYDLYKEEIGNE